MAWKSEPLTVRTLVIRWFMRYMNSECMTVEHADGTATDYSLESVQTLARKSHARRRELRANRVSNRL